MNEDGVPTSLSATFAVIDVLPIAQTTQGSLDRLLELSIAELIGDSRSASVKDPTRPVGAKVKEDVNSKIERADLSVSYMV